MALEAARLEKRCPGPSNAFYSLWANNRRSQVFRFGIFHVELSAGGVARTNVRRLTSIRAYSAEPEIVRRLSVRVKFVSRFDAGLGNAADAELSRITCVECPALQG